MSSKHKNVFNDHKDSNLQNLDRPSRPRCLSALPANIKEILAAIAKSKVQGSKD